MGDAGVGAYGVSTLYSASGEHINANNASVVTRVIAEAIDNGSTNDVQSPAVRIAIAACEPEHRRCATISAGSFTQAPVRIISISNENLHGRVLV